MNRLSNMNCLVLFALICAIQAISAAPADEVDCTKLEEIFEDRGAASAGVSFTSEKYGLLTSKEAVEKKCPEMNDALKTLKRYNSKCHTGQTQQVFSAIFRTRQEFTDKICKEVGTEASQKRLEAVKCVVDNVKERAKKAEEKALLLSQVLSETEIKDMSERVKRTCCSIQVAREDLIAAVKPECEKSVPLLSEYVDSYTAETLSLICPDYEKLVKDGECAKLGQLPIEGVKPKFNFMLAPMVKAVKALEH